MEFGGVGILQIGDETIAFRPLEMRQDFGCSPILKGEIVHGVFEASNRLRRDRVNSGRPTIKDVIFNDPATIVVWSDGTKTVVKCQPGDLYSKETGLALCIAKKFLGNKGNFNEVFKKYIEGYDSPLVNGIPKVGTHIKILDAGCGAYGANQQIGRVTTKKHTSGMLSSDPGYNVEVEDDDTGITSKIVVVRDYDNNVPGFITGMDIVI